MALRAGPPTFGALLRRYRLAAGRSQAALAEHSSLSLRAISDRERGVRRAPHADTVQFLGDALSLSGEERAPAAQATAAHG